MKRVYVVCMVLFAGIFLFSIMGIFSYHKDAGKNAGEIKEVIREVSQRLPEGMPNGKEEETEPAVQQIDFARLRQMNEDAIGWIVFHEPYINNPLVQTSDNSYYLKHSFRKKENAAGCLFMDCRNESFDDRNVVIYGHNMLDHTMFGSLKDVFEEEFWEETEYDRIIRITDTEQQVREYKIFSYYITGEQNDYCTTSFFAAAAYAEFLKEITARSLRKLDVTVTADDHILTLSTCAGAAGTNKRRVIHAKLTTTSFDCNKKTR